MECCPGTRPHRNDAPFRGVLSLPSPWRAAALRVHWQQPRGARRGRRGRQRTTELGQHQLVQALNASRWPPSSSVCLDRVLSLACAVASARSFCCMAAEQEAAAGRGRLPSSLAERMPTALVEIGFWPDPRNTDDDRARPECSVDPAWDPRARCAHGSSSSSLIELRAHTRGLQPQCGRPGPPARRISGVVRARPILLSIRVRGRAGRQQHGLRHAHRRAVRVAGRVRRHCSVNRAPPPLLRTAIACVQVCALCRAPRGQGPVEVHGAYQPRGTPGCRWFAAVGSRQRPHLPGSVRDHLVAEEPRVCRPGVVGRSARQPRHMWEVHGLGSLLRRALARPHV